ncbi:hypothetical protein PM082_004485 [Marasmius tenuissimus]|nr:hypothetical protein PM082_004485 [Marasmius tenuissimus]
MLTTMSLCVERLRYWTLLNSKHLCNWLRTLVKLFRLHVSNVVQMCVSIPFKFLL